MSLLVDGEAYKWHQNLNWGKGLNVQKPLFNMYIYYAKPKWTCVFPTRKAALNLNQFVSWRSLSMVLNVWSLLQWMKTAGLIFFTDVPGKKKKNWRMMLHTGEVCCTTISLSSILWLIPQANWNVNVNRGLTVKSYEMGKVAGSRSIFCYLKFMFLFELFQLFLSEIWCVSVWHARGHLIL